MKELSEKLIEESSKRREGDAEMKQKDETVMFGFLCILFSYVQFKANMLDY